MRFSRRRNGPIEDLRSGRVTPAEVRRRIADLKTEVDDAVFFKYPADKIASLKASIGVLEAALEPGSAAYDEGARERAAVYAKEIEETTRPSVAREMTPRERAEAELDRLRLRLRVLQNDLYEAKRMRDPQSEIDRLAGQIEGTRLAIRDLTESFEPKKANRGNKKLRFPNYAQGVKRDLEAGRMSMKDLSRQLNRYRRLLSDTRSSDPEARGRIASLAKRVAALESLAQESN